MKCIKLDIMNGVSMLVKTHQLVFNRMVRYAFNRCIDSNGALQQKEVRWLVSEKFDNPSWLKQCAVKDGLAMYEVNKVQGSKTVVFGGLKNLTDYLKGKKTKKQYRDDKLLPITIQGEAPQHGNRLFNFHFDENYIVYKASKKEHYKIEFKKPRKNLLNELLQLQDLAKLKQLPITVKLNAVKKKLYIIFDETQLNHEKYEYLKSRRVLSLDLNPNSIGVSILEFDEYNSEKFKVLHKYVISTLKLNRKNISANKRRYELIKICHGLDKQINVWKCKKLCIENLNIKSYDKNKGKEFNRLCNNVWNRKLIITKLKMLSGIHGYDLVEVNPSYSSFIGNILYGNKNTPDPVASSIEVGRRGYNKFKKGHFYPAVPVSHQMSTGKQTLSGLSSWKDMYQKAKESKLKYRFLLSDYIGNAVFSKNYTKKRISLYTFA